MDVIQNIDSAENKQAADNKLSLWSKKLRDLGAVHIAGVEIRKVSNSDYRIDLTVYVDRGSDEYKLFVARFLR